MCCPTQWIEKQPRVLLWVNGEYLAGAFVGRRADGRAYVHTQKTGDKAGAIEFCSSKAAQQFAWALHEAEGKEWLVVKVDRDA